jgi:c-di-GMP-binding flagellar brake protein YcgR
VAGKTNRKHLRVQADPSAPIRVDIMGNGFLDVLNARDISVGGLGIRVPHGFVGCDLHREVDLIVTLGRTRPFKAKATIRHYNQNEHVFGVEFSALSSQQQGEIETYIQSCLRRRSRRHLRAVTVPVGS